MLPLLLSAALQLTSPAPNPSSTASCKLHWPQLQASATAAGVKIKEIPQAERQALEQEYNAAPPQSHEHLTHAYVAQKNGTVWMVLVTGKDCVLTVFRITGPMGQGT